MIRNRWARYAIFLLHELRLCKQTNKKLFILVLTCPFGHHQFGFTAGSIPFGGVCSHSDRVSGVWLESSNHHFLWETGTRREQDNFEMYLEFFMIWPTFMQNILRYTEGTLSKAFPGPLYSFLQGMH